MHHNYFIMHVRARNLIILFSSILFSCRQSDVSRINHSLIQQIIHIPVSITNHSDTTNGVILDLPKTIEFDTIIEGDVIEKRVTFSNRGTVPLVIGDVQSSCGCTAIKYTTDLIKPDSSGSINIRFNSKGWPFEQNKSIFIFANTFPNQTILSLHGYVKPNSIGYD